MKLATKIILGFVALVVISILLGGLAVFEMLNVKSGAMALADDYMPATAVANNVERSSLRTMFEMRGYAFTEERAYLTNAQQNLAEVQQFLGDARKLAQQQGNQNLAFLLTAANQAEVKAQEYDQLARQSVAATDGLETDREAMNREAQSYMQACAGYLTSQQGRLQTVLAGTNAAALDVAEVQDRVSKIAVANEIIDLGNAIRLGNFKAQALRSPELFRETQQKFTQVFARLDALKAVTKQEVNLKQIEECRAAGKGYDAAMSSFLKHWLEREDLARRRTAAADAVLAEARNTASTSLDTATKTSKEAAISLARAATTMLLGLGIAAILGGVLSTLITRSITRPIRQVSNHLSASVEQTLSAAVQVSASSQSLAESASQEAASLEETSASLEEIGSMTRRNGENASQGKALGSQARESAAAGLERLQEMNSTLGSIKGAVAEMESAVKEIQTSSQEVAKIIKTIDEIAFQTNLLALNAAVEAARAGEAGMGFAVVADEVRALAQRCAQAARDTSEQIASAVKRSELGGVASKRVAQSLVEVEGTAGSLGQVFQGIAQQIKSLDEVIGQIASASHEQNQGISEINVAVGQMDKVTQSNAAAAEEGASAATELNAQAEAMKDAVSGLIQLVDGRGQHLKVAAPARPPTGVGSKPTSQSPRAARTSKVHHPHGPTIGDTRTAALATATPEEAAVASGFQEL